MSCCSVIFKQKPCLSAVRDMESILRGSVLGKSKTVKVPNNTFKCCAQKLGYHSIHRHHFLEEEMLRHSAYPCCPGKLVGGNVPTIQHTVCLMSVVTLQCLSYIFAFFFFSCLIYLCNIHMWIKQKI